jgi:hypothetical protein
MSSNKLKLDRNLEIVDSFLNGESVLNIGKKYNISRQRVDQIIKKIVPKEARDEFMEQKRKERIAKRINITCLRCGKIFLVNPSWKNRKYCDKNCQKLSPEERKGRLKERYKLNNERHIKNGYTKRYYQKNKEKILKYRKDNKEKINEYLRKWRKKNCDRINKTRKKYYLKNRDKLLKRMRDRYHKNKNKI